ncbi:sugar ABC transporter permease [Streptomyces sp. 110]|uniref:Sugar ABC transporter permease n=1 Tax=Streptomyces endocoffeicus TaxID=2898945 RepID=A0ABS1Q0F3_9ACTN|nr:sugar ABC transporter permease [Streptomyces endocoffeicus]MBL1118158.1 sugar ABC transporter permease [Streptomyces endocoffeicus]
MPTLLVTPAATFLMVFFIVPLSMVAVLTLFDYQPLTRSVSFVGLRNWHRILTSPELQQATVNTLLYAVMTVPLIVGVSLLAALGIHALPRWGALWRTVYFLPTIATMAAMSVVWRWLFYPGTGPVDATIGRLTGATDWLHSTTLALPAIAVIGSWAGIGSSMVMFLAGLTSVPQHLHEAGRLDGAGPWHRFWHITWPALGPSTMFALIIATRDALRVFDQVHVMTDGGPLGSTETLADLQWRYGVSYLDIGSGSIVNTVLLGLVLVTVAAQYLAGGRRLERAGAR